MQDKSLPTLSRVLHVKWLLCNKWTWVFNKRSFTKTYKGCKVLLSWNCKTSTDSTTARWYILWPTSFLCITVCYLFHRMYSGKWNDDYEL